MKTFLIVVLVLIFVPMVVLLVNDYYVKRKFRKLALQKYRVIEPLMRKLSSKEVITDVEILNIAKDPSLRHVVFRTLEAYSRKDLFPSVYFTQEKGAESFLVNWLEFPTELGTAPHEIELCTKVTLNEVEMVDYYVFKYRTRRPHWAAKYNWMMGVSGPYREETKPYDVPLRVFSRFNTTESVTPESEAQWVHEHVSRAT